MGRKESNQTKIKRRESRRQKFCAQNWPTLYRLPFSHFSFEDSNSNGYGDSMAHPYRPMDMRSDFGSSELLHKSRKNKEDKYCGVCGDRALGYNFDAISCESCKAFFRRNAPKGLVRIPLLDTFSINARLSWSVSRSICTDMRHIPRKNLKKFFLSHDVASGSEIMPCNKIYKALVVYRFYP